MRCIPIIFKATMLLFLILMLPRLVLAAKMQDLGQAGEMIVSDRTLSDMKETETAMLAQWKKESAGQSRKFIGGGKYIDPNGEEWKYSVVLPSKMEPGKKYPVFLGMTTYALFLRPQRSRYGYRTRAISETFGDIHRYVEALEAEVHRLNNGEALFQGYQSYFSWLSGISGLPVGEILAQFDVESPLWKATFTRDGMRVA